MIKFHSAWRSRLKLTGIIKIDLLVRNIICLIQLYPDPYYFVTFQNKILILIQTKIRIRRQENDTKKNPADPDP